MKIARWLLFFPCAVVAACVVLDVTDWDASYSGLRWPLIVDSIIGLTPLVAHNVLTMSVFVGVASLLAPSGKKPVAVATVVLGCIWSLVVASLNPNVFSVVGWCSKLAGAIGMLLIVFWWVDRKRPGETTSGTGP